MGCCVVGVVCCVAGCVVCGRQTHKAITMKEVNHKCHAAWDDACWADARGATRHAWDAWRVAAKHRKRLR